MRLLKAVKFYLISLAAYLILTAMLLTALAILFIPVWCIIPTYTIYILYPIAILFGILQGIIIEALVTYSRPDNYS